ncbi:hypothetical protein K1719_042806 [Acacia pycnantha]|nr:hypothetical protein K1719_042806 [Acacia pycnantha]
MFSPNSFHRSLLQVKPSQLLFGIPITLTFNEIQKLLSKTKGKLVGELMTPAHMVVRETTNLEDAARLLLETKFRCLPIVDADGKMAVKSLGIRDLHSQVHGRSNFGLNGHHGVKCALDKWCDGFHAQMWCLCVFAQIYQLSVVL